MPRKGRGKAQNLDPLALPTRLQTALQALYGHYEKTFALWEQAKIAVPPCFIVVCNNTSTSKLVYDYISGFRPLNADGTEGFQQGRLALFCNFDEHGNPLARPNTFLIDSEQLESGEALEDDFRDMAAVEIERFTPEIASARRSAGRESLTDDDLLREVMNTVGKPGSLGGSIRCVVSVSMLTEGWDANTVTHVLGVRAFGTQLLCEQVVGRALRRQSYDLNDEGLFNVEYADVLGIPFDFTAKPVVAPPQPPRETVQVKAVRPDRDALEIRFPRVQGYRVELPEERLTATFNDDSVLELTPDLVGPSITRNAGIIGEAVDFSLEHLDDLRRSTVLFHLTAAPALHEVARPRRGARSCTCSASSSASPRSGSTPVWSARAAPTRPSSCTRSWPTWPASASPPASPAPGGRAAHQGRARSLQPHRLHHPRELHHVEDRPLGDRRPALPRQLGHPRQRLGGRVLPRGRVAPAGPGLRQEPQPRPGGALPLRLGDAHVPARFHRAGGRRPRRRRPAAPDRRDQGLPARGRQGEEGHHGDLLGARREQPPDLAGGPSPSSPRSTRSRPTSRLRSSASSTR